MIEYLSDGEGPRVAKKVGGAVVRQWLYHDHLKPAAELDGTGNLVARFVYPTKANVPDLVIRGGNTYRVVSDQVGLPVLAVNIANSCDVPFRAGYESFGKATAVGGTDLSWMPFGFAGGMYDPDTELVRFGARDYDPEIGRWTAKDPLPFRGETNAYLYAGANPVGFIDPTGALRVIGDTPCDTCRDTAEAKYEYCVQDCRNRNEPPQPAAGGCGDSPAGREEDDCERQCGQPYEQELRQHCDPICNRDEAEARKKAEGDQRNRNR